jgi:integrase/recombinase XerD
MAIKRAQIDDAILLDPQGLSALVAEHLSAMRARNYSEATLVNRSAYLRRFVAWCADRGLTRPSDVTKAVLEHFRYLARTNQIDSNPAADIELPKVERRLPRSVLTVSEVERVLSVPDLDTPLGLRDRAILETLYSTGVRRMEIANLCVYDLDFERGTLMVRQGTGKKDRLIPIGERALAWIAKYLSDARSELAVDPREEHLFLRAWGGPLTLEWLSDRVRSYVLRANLGKSGSCHLFRHTMATLMLDGGADIRHVQEMLGHADIKTTQIYTQVSVHKLKAIHDATHPGAKLERKEHE